METVSTKDSETSFYMKSFFYSMGCIEPFCMKMLCAGFVSASLLSVTTRFCDREWPTVNAEHRSKLDTPLGEKRCLPFHSGKASKCKRI